MSSAWRAEGLTRSHAAASAAPTIQLVTPRPIRRFHTGLFHTAGLAILHACDFGLNASRCPKCRGFFLSQQQQALLRSVEMQFICASLSLMVSVPLARFGDLTVRALLC